MVTAADHVRINAADHVRINAADHVTINAADHVTINAAATIAPPRRNVRALDGYEALTQSFAARTTMFNVGQVQALPVTVQDIQQATRRDATLGKVYKYVQQGWPKQVSEELLLYSNRQTELSTENGCLLWRIRVIVP